MKLKRSKWIIVIVAIMCVTVVGVWLSMRPAPVSVPDTVRYPVRGLDISAHNGDVDFDMIKSQGFSFVFIKASEGNSWKDSRFHKNIARARKAGLKVGVYHFFRFDSPSYMQSLNLLHSLRGQAIDLPVVIDLEQFTNPNDRTPERVASQLRTLINHLEAYGHTVIIYTNKDGYDDFVRRRLDDYPVWICSFSEPSPDIAWTFRQYTHSGRVKGVEGPVDLNVFNGTEQQWRQWCSTRQKIMQ